MLSFYFIPGGLDLVSGCILTPLAWSCACKWPRLNIGRRKHCWKSEWLKILLNNHVTIPAWFHSTIACQPFATSCGFALVRSPSDVKLCSDTTLLGKPPKNWYLLGINFMSILLGKYHKPVNGHVLQNWLVDVLLRSVQFDFIAPPRSSSCIPFFINDPQPPPNQPRA